LRQLAYHYRTVFSIVYTDNLGPHRKLLPLLARKWGEDCVIVTYDDENQRGIKTFLQQSVRYYVATGGAAVVSLRARKMGIWCALLFSFELSSTPQTSCSPT